MTTEYLPCNDFKVHRLKLASTEAMKHGLVLRGNQLLQKRLTKKKPNVRFKTTVRISQITYIIIKHMFKIQLVRGGNFNRFTYEWSAYVVCLLKRQMDRIKILAKKGSIGLNNMNVAQSLYLMHNLLDCFIQKIGDSSFKNIK